jgi:hypothetical protein
MTTPAEKRGGDDLVLEYLTNHPSSTTTEIHSSGVMNTPACYAPTDSWDAYEGLLVHMETRGILRQDSLGRWSFTETYQ